MKINFTALLDAHNSPWIDEFNCKTPFEALRFLIELSEKEKDPESQIPRPQPFVDEEALKFIEKIFAIKALLKANNLDEALQQVLPLMDKTFKAPVEELRKSIPGKTYEELKSNLPNYEFAKSRPLLELYCQFLMRFKFFEESESFKAAAFEDFQEEIILCEGGMVSRLANRVSTGFSEDLVGKITQEILAKSRIPQSQEIHVPVFVRKYLFGQPQEDYNSINIPKSLSFPFLVELSTEALNGNYTRRMFAPLIKTLIESAIATKEFNSDLLNLSRKNPNGGELANLSQRLLEQINAYLPALEYNLLNGDLLSIAPEVSELIYNENLDGFLSEAQREKIIDEAGGLEKFIDDCVEKSLELTEENLVKKLDVSKEIARRIEEQDEIMNSSESTDQDKSKAKSLKANLENNREKLRLVLFPFSDIKENIENIAKLYAMLLPSQGSYFTTEKFWEKGETILEHVEENQTFVLMEEAAKIIPSEVRKFLEERLSYLRLENNQIVAEPENSSVSGFCYDLRMNDFISEHYFTKTFLESTQQLPDFGVGYENFGERYLFLLFNSELEDNYFEEALDRFLDSNYASKTITDGLVKKRLNSQQQSKLILSAYKKPNLQQLFKGDVFVSINGVNEACSKIILALYGEALIKNSPQDFVSMTRELNPNDFRIIVIGFLVGENGRILLEKNPQRFFDLFDRLTPIDVYKFLKSKTAQELAKNHTPEFVKQLRKLSDVPQLVAILEAPQGAEFCKKDVEGFIVILKGLPYWAVMDVLKSNVGKIIIENRPQQFLDFLQDNPKWISSFSKSSLDEVKILLEKRRIDLLARANPAKFAKIIAHIDDKEFLAEILLAEIPPKTNIVDLLAFKAPSELTQTLLAVQDYEALEKILKFDVEKRLSTTEQERLKNHLENMRYFQEILSLEKPEFNSEKVLQEFLKILQRMENPAPELFSKILLSKTAQLWAKDFPDMFFTQLIHTIDKRSRVLLRKIVSENSYLSEAEENYYEKFWDNIENQRMYPEIFQKHLGNFLGETLAIKNPERFEGFLKERLAQEIDERDVIKNWIPLILETLIGESGQAYVKNHEKRFLDFIEENLPQPNVMQHITESWKDKRIFTQAGHQRFTQIFEQSKKDQEEFNPLRSLLPKSFFPRDSDSTEIINALEKITSPYWQDKALKVLKNRSFFLRYEFENGFETFKEDLKNRDLTNPIFQKFSELAKFKLEQIHSPSSEVQPEASEKIAQKNSKERS